MIRYVVLENQRKVVAYLKGTSLDVVKRLLKKDVNGLVGENVYQHLRLPNTYKVTVKCHPEDKFDAEVGKAIAKQRLLDKYYRDYDKKISMFKTAMLKLSESITV